MYIRLPHCESLLKTIIGLQQEESFVHQDGSQAFKPHK